jgi:hypothetical protein
LIEENLLFEAKRKSFGDPPKFEKRHLALGGQLLRPIRRTMTDASPFRGAIRPAINIGKNF